MEPVGLLGSISDHGGVAVTASTDVLVGGIGVVRFGDLHVCPIPRHGTTPFFSSSQVTADALPVVRVGVDAAGCGAVLVTGAFDVLAE